MDTIRSQGSDVSLDDLARAAGVSKPVLYGEFGDRAGIADAVAVALADEVEKQVTEDLSSSWAFTVDAMVRLIVEALVDVIVREPELYTYVVRVLRSGDGLFLDNALVRVCHEKASMLLQLVATAVPDGRLTVLIDGLFGFAFGAIESWKQHRSPTQDEFVDDLSAVVVAGIQSVIDRYPPSASSKA